MYNVLDECTVRMNGPSARGATGAASGRLFSTGGLVALVL